MPRRGKKKGKRGGGGAAHDSLLILRALPFRFPRAGIARKEERKEEIQPSLLAMEEQPFNMSSGKPISWYN